MIYSEEVVLEIIRAAVIETIRQNRSLEGYPVDELSMLMLLSGPIKKAVAYLNECAKESCQWQERYQTLLNKKSGTDFNHSKEKIKLERNLEKLKEQVSELKHANAEQLKEIEALKKLSHSVDGDAPDDNEFVTLSKAEYEKLLDDKRKAEEKAKRAPATSNDSSLPSSKNPIGHKHKRRCSTRRKSERGPGAVVGHPPAFHKQVPNPDEIIELYPETCPYCGEKIAKEELHKKTTRQIVGRPVLHVPITEYRVLEGHCCNCGEHVEGEFPQEVSAYFCFSPAYKAFIAYLNAFLQTPVQRMVEFLNTVSNVKVSAGFVQSSFKYMSDALDNFMEEIWQKVNSAEVNCLDETAFKVSDGGDGKQWVWGNAALDIMGRFLGVYMALCDDRTHKQISNICAGKEAEKAVHDRKADYFNKEYLKCDTHQVCLEHLYRDCESVLKNVPECDFPKRLQAMIDRIFEIKHSWEDPEKEPDITQLEKDLDALLDERPTLEYADHQKTIDSFIKGILKVRPYLLTCLKHFAVPATNNLIERAFRLLKAKLKVSGCFRTGEGAADFVKIFCAIQNARLWDMNPIELLIREAENYQKRKTTKNNETSEYIKCEHMHA